MRLHDHRQSGNGCKVRLLLAHLARPCDHVMVDILKGESRTAAFLARNPNGRIPVLELDDGTCLAESNAIPYWLAQDSPFWPASRWSRSTFPWDHRSKAPAPGGHRAQRRLPEEP